MNFKKTLARTSGVFLAALLLAACNGIQPHAGGSQILRILNWEDYIYLNDKENGYEEKDLVDQFEDYIWDAERVKVDVVYDTFDTNETMLNSLQTGKSVYDLVCPSDYMIQKMIVNDMLEPVDMAIPNYEDYASPYLKEIFANLEATNGVTGVSHSLSEYAVGYMWGTFGILYNPTYPTFAERELSPDAITSDMEDWNSLWNSKYKDTISVKDSMRDTYSVGIMRVFDQEIRDLQKLYLDESKPEDYNVVTYNAELTRIFNRCDPDTVAAVKEELLALKENIYGFENDSGKQDIVTGKIGINLAWSGDAVYAMNQADYELEDDTKLYYSIPETGGNIWFDGWVMPKSDSLNKDLAQKFLNFVSDPTNAAKNMDYIGYSSFIGGEDINALVHEWYDVRGEEWETPLDEWKAANDITAEYIAYDLSYFFGDTVETQKIIYIEEDDVGRQLYAQYPESKMIPRLSLMRDFGENNRYILAMWEEFKSSSLPGWAIVLIVVGALAVAGVGGFFLYRKNLAKKNRSTRRQQVASSRR